MAESGVEAAIRELERERKKIAGVISMLKRIRQAHHKVSGNPVRRRRRLSAEARRRMFAARPRTVGGTPDGDAESTKMMQIVYCSSWKCKAFDFF